MLRVIRLVAILGITLAFHGTSARAQYLDPPGYGPWGWRGPSSASYVNLSSALRSHATYAQRNWASGAFDNANAYYNKVRDPEYFERDDRQTRSRPEGRAARHPSVPARAASTTGRPPAPARPVRPLAGFFDRDGRLVWPADAPAAGDLGQKRDMFDRAMRGVLDEVDERGSARASTVDDARTKLLDYGRPALRRLRVEAPPAVSDHFHNFLLDLYDSLGRAALPRPRNPDGALRVVRSDGGRREAAR